MEKKIAVVGCGHWGKNLVRNFAELGVLASVCDPNTHLSQKFSKQYGVSNLTYAEVIKDKGIDGIVLAVPAPLHSALAMEAMDAGKHVYVEKPLAMNREDAAKMIWCARMNNVKLMVGHLMQYHPIFVALRQLVIAGKLGRLKHIYSNRMSFGKIRSEEDVIWSFAPHDISMILSMTGEEPELVDTNSTSIVQKNIADMATIHMKFKSGVKAQVSLSWLHPFKEQKLCVIGEKGMAVFDDTETWDKKLALYHHGVTSAGGTITLEKDDVEYPVIPQSEPLQNECLHFIKVITEKIQPLTDGNEGLGVLNVLTAATESQIKKTAVGIKV